MKRILFFMFVMILVAAVYVWDRTSDLWRSLALIGGMVLVAAALILLLRHREPGGYQEERRRSGHGPDVIVYPDSPERLAALNKQQAYQYRQGWLTAERVHTLTGGEAGTRITVSKVGRAELGPGEPLERWDDSQQAEYERVQRRERK